MRYTILIFCLIAVFSSCKNSAILEEKEMAALLLDLQLADAYATTCYQQDTASDTRNRYNKNLDTLKHYSELALAAHNLSPEDYKLNLEWYKTHANELDSAYSYAMHLANQLETKIPVPKPLNNTSNAAVDSVQKNRTTDTSY
ncbi:MAG: hypothetical protein RL660_510 [Bacteroidota bacterium]|jgi:hypothetical protein